MDHFHVLLAATGSVASIKLPEIIRKLVSGETETILEVRVVVTKTVSEFVSHEALLEAGAAQVYCDENEWAQWHTAHTVLHVDLRRWADVLLIAPLDANTMAKLSGGLCDNLLTCVARAWDMARPVIFCPAMNTHMWTHPLTSKHVQVLTDELKYLHVPPIAKRLACGDVGVGAMASVDTIVEYTRQQVETYGSEARKRIAE
ncbi:phosphopantothenoylcysteine decarboxylase-like [Sycon ciliatum]|uniref:phosphopantothenoylcysteine decarboxylase-like n=1 Tax=Sycon ciliatum TaxID=27933 RepID=UPI0031F6B871|eukprot:scpid97738/ scgid11817/ Phosphopantothenoylcysteine decarboxylase; CoaC